MEEGGYPPDYGIDVLQRGMRRFLLRCSRFALEDKNAIQRKDASLVWIAVIKTFPELTLSFSSDMIRTVILSFMNELVPH